MEPISGLLLVAGAAGFTKALSENTDRLVNALEAKGRTSEPALDRVVIVERPQYNELAAASMKLDK